MLPSLLKPDQDWKQPDLSTLSESSSLSPRTFCCYDHRCPCGLRSTFHTPAKKQADGTLPLPFIASVEREPKTFKQDVISGPGRTEGKEAQTSISLFHVHLSGTNQVPDPAENEGPAP